MQVKVFVKNQNGQESLAVGELHSGSYVELSLQAQHEAIKGVLIGYIASRGDEYINHAMDADVYELDEDEIEEIYDRFFKENEKVNHTDFIGIGDALYYREFDSLVDDGVKYIVEHREKYFRVELSATVKRTIYVKAPCEGDVEFILDNQCYEEDLFDENTDFSDFDFRIVEEDPQYMSTCEIADAIDVEDLC